MTKLRVRLGELLIQAQILTEDQLKHALDLQQIDSRRLGTILVEHGMVSETQVTQILSQQLSVPWVSLYHTDFSRQLLNHVPQELAERLCLIPIFMRRVRGYGDVLYVAMDDPSDDDARQEVERFSGLPVRAMIAPPSHIKDAIRAYYGPSEPPASSLPPELLSSIPPSVGKPRGLVQAEAAAVEEASAAGSESVPESGPVIEAREVTMPPPKKRSAARMVTVTLLDGTQVNLPAAGSARTQAAAEEGLTARDLVTALTAVANGADASEVLGDDVNWQGMFATLLSVLLKKHLLADWEFVEELKRLQTGPRSPQNSE